MAQYSFHFIAAHALQQTSGNGHQSSVLVPASGKGIGLVAREITDFRHFDTALLASSLYGSHQPALFFCARVFDDLRASAALGHPLGDEQ
jgi:hypothetical protein